MTPLVHGEEKCMAKAPMPCGTGGKELPAMQENVADPDETENLPFTGAAIASI